MEGCAKCGKIIADKITRIAITIRTSTIEIFVKTRILITRTITRAREMPNSGFRWPETGLINTINSII